MFAAGAFSCWQMMHLLIDVSAEDDPNKGKDCNKGKNLYPKGIGIAEHIKPPSCLSFCYTNGS